MNRLSQIRKVGLGPLRFLVNMSCWDNCHGSMITRLTIVAIGFAICFSLVSVRLIAVAMTSPHERHGIIAKNTQRKEIVDRNGKLLAVNIPTSSLFANPQHMVNIKQDIMRLAKAIPGIDIKKLLMEVKPDKTFVWIKRDLGPTEEKTINDLGIAGFYFEKEDRRLYTYGNLLSHILGYVGRENVGLAGVEKMYDDFLSNKDVENNSLNLKLTIDVRVQNIVSEELDNIMTEFRAPSGIGIVADPNTGEIIALVSKPDFDAHHVNQATKEQLFNNATLGVFEMGSVMKTLTMAIGFDTGTINLNDAYNLSGLRVANFNVKDLHPVSGWHSVGEIFLHSSNIGVAQIALETGQEAFQSYYKKLGLLDKLQLELPETSSPLYPRNMNWNDLTLTTMSYGYSISMTPMHFIQAAIPAVNGGYMYPLTLVKKDGAKRDGVRVFKESTSDAMRKIMRLVVAYGTGRKANVKGYLVAGKTGTANIQEGKHYVTNARRSSFLSVTPAMDPKYVIYVMLNKPLPTKDSYGYATAGWNAAPATRNIISRMMALYGTKAYNEDDPEIVDALYVEQMHDEI